MKTQAEIIGDIEYHMRQAEKDYRYAKTLPLKTKVNIETYSRADAKVKALRLCYNLATGESNNFPLEIHK